MRARARKLTFGSVIVPAKVSLRWSTRRPGAREKRTSRRRASASLKIGNVEALLLVLKVIGVAAAAVIGVLGIVSDLKDKKGRRTRWGNAAVAGIVGSALVAVAAQLVEEHRSQRTSAEAAAQTRESVARMERILTDLSRSMQPLEPMKVTFWYLTLPMSDKRLAAYKTRLDRSVEGFLSSPYSQWPRWKEQGINPVSYTLEGQFAYDFRVSHRGGAVGIDPLGNSRAIKVKEVDQVEVKLGTRIAPNPKSDPLAHALTRVDGIKIIINKAPIDPRSLDRTSKGDIVASVVEAQPLSIVVRPRKEAYYLRGSFMASREEWRNLTGRLLSIPDLAGAQLLIIEQRPDEAFLELSDKPPSLLHPGHDDYYHLRRMLRPGPITLSIGGRQREVAESEITQHVHNSLGVIWEYRFPAQPF